MTTTQLIKQHLNQLPVGYPFSYRDFDLDKSQQQAGIKALNRMVKTGTLAKIGKGKFYKPETSPFGELLPAYQEIIRDLLQSNQQVIGYVTGVNLFNQLGLTTQVSNIIQIAKNDIRPPLQRLHYTVRFIRQKNVITEQNIPLLQLLDAIRFIKEIPDTTIIQSIRRLLALLGELSSEQQQQLTQLAVNYPPASRALLGLMWEKMEKRQLSQQLYASLNPVTSYRFGDISEVLPNQQAWNIQ